MGGHRRHRRAAAACCPACAATARRRPGRGARGAPWTWVAVLGAVWALVPVAALTGGDGTALAQPAPAALAPPAIPASTVPAAPRPAPAPAGPEQTAPARPEPPPVAWRESLALGTPNAGRLVRGVRLPTEGRGFYTYNPATQAPFGGAERQWGTDHLVREVLGLGVWWQRTHPGQPRLGVGDLSRPEGGPFLGPGVGHASHQNGRDVDIRLPRSDGREAGADPGSYDRALTQAVVDRLVAHGAELVLIGPSLDLIGPPGVVMPWPNHDGHLHVRFPDPDGTGN